MYHRWKHCFLLQDVYCIISTERKRERDDLSVGPTNLNLTWLHRASKTPWDNPKQNKSLLLGGCWVQSLLFPMRLTNRCLSQIQVEDVFSPSVTATPRKILHGTPQKCRFGRWMKMMFLWKIFGWIFCGKKPPKSRSGCKNGPSWIFFPTHEWGGWPCEAKSSSTPVVQLDGMFFFTFKSLRAFGSPWTACEPQIFQGLIG